MYQLEAFRIGLHEAVLDAVVDHLHIMAGAVRADMPIHARVLAFIGWMAVLALIALTLTAVSWLILTYIGSVFNRAIRA